MSCHVSRLLSTINEAITTCFGYRRFTSAISCRLTSIGRSEMSSMLLKPIMRRPSQSIEEYRELTLVMGSPIVFHTAPPHPASKARMICSPQLVGGADASQKGLRQGMPQIVVARVGLGTDTGDLQPRGNPDACAFSVSDCVDHLAAAVGAITARKIFRIRGLARGPVDHDAAVLTLDLGGNPCLGRLSDRQDQQIHR